MKGLLFIFGILLFAGTGAAAAWSDPATGITWHYTVSAGRAEITGAADLPSPDLVLPAAVNGIPVERVGYRAFEFLVQVTSLTLPEGITAIGDRAFEGCRALKTLTLPAGLRDIGNQAFSGCQKLGAFTLPGSVSRIGDRAFSGVAAFYCEEDGFRYESDAKHLLLTAPVTLAGEITLAGSVRFIHPDAFNGCYNLTAVSLPEGLLSIGERAFYKCSKLTALEIPETVTRIGDGAFAGCEFLRRLTFQGPPPKAVSPFSDGEYARAVTHARCNPEYAAAWDLQIRAGKWDELIFESEGIPVLLTVLGGGSVQTAGGGAPVIPETGPVTLTAVPAEGYRFIGWSGDCVSPDAALTLTAAGRDRCALTAFFLPEALFPSGGSGSTPDAAAIAAAVDALLAEKVADGALVDAAGAQAAAADVIDGRISRGELLTQEQIDALALETPLIEVSENAATLTLSLQKSTDLASGTWGKAAVKDPAVSNGSLTVTVAREEEEDTAFYKVIVPREQGN